MQLSQNGTLDSPHRRITAGSFVVLPVAADWDARFWSVRIASQHDTQVIAAGEAVSLFKIRMDTGGSISVRVSDNPPPRSRGQAGMERKQLREKGIPDN